MKQTLYILTVFSLLAIACNKEETLAPSGDSKAYSLPQGNNAFDGTIKSYYDKYGCYLLYKFNDRDAYWTPSGWTNARYDSAFKRWVTGFLVEPAEEQYIAKQLEVIDRLWFRFYSDKFLEEFLPAKVLLCSAVDSTSLGYDFSTTPITFYLVPKAVAAWYSYDNISVSFGNAAVETMTPQDSGVFVWKVNTIFMQQIFNRTPIPATSDFTKVTSYATSFANQAAAYAAGSLANYYAATAQADWQEYILAMTGYPESVLNATPPGTAKSFVGILHPAKDTNGRIRQRYDLVRNYFITNYDVDLQEIGNAAIAR